jgi:ABC-2 type transport system permease protein
MTTGSLRHGPSAVGDDLRRFWSLTWTLAITEWRLRFYGSVLGLAWTLARPFLFFAVIYVVFSTVADFEDQVRDYPVVVLFGMLLFQYFAEVTGGSVTALNNRESLLRKVRFPRLVVPMSVALTAVFNFGMALVPAIVFALISGVEVRWSWLQLIPLFMLLTALAVGIGMLLSALFVRFRDISPIWDITSQVLFYISPVLYVATMIPDKYQQEYMVNPIAAIFTQVRHAVVDPAAPTAGDVIGGNVRLLIPLAVIAIAFALGAWVFRREAPRIAENL